ncbi:MAG: hypothetical protein HY017_10515 [Betaproteobacteria bacterium]|nr:hypothetical protein [Betaproteobacteria bacterium]
MNEPPNKSRRYMLRVGDTAIVRTGSHEKFRKIAAEVLANPPKPKKGESIVRELNELRHRGGPL